MSPDSLFYLYRVSRVVRGIFEGVSECPSLVGYIMRFPRKKV